MALNISYGGDAVTIDRRQFMAAAAAGLGSQLVSKSGDALAQTAARPLPPDSGLFPGFEAKWVHTNGADIFLRHGGTGQPRLTNPIFGVLSDIQMILARNPELGRTVTRPGSDSV